jgi:hypothetical protein
MSEFHRVIEIALGTFLGIIGAYLALRGVINDLTRREDGTSRLYPSRKK